MTESIKRMLAERAAVAAQLEADRKAREKNARRWQGLVDKTLAMIDKAAPFIDEGCDHGWKPSVKLKLLYFTASTCERDEAAKDALLFILEMLDRGRRLWVEGLHPDPWADSPAERRTDGPSPPNN